MPPCLAHSSRTCSSAWLLYVFIRFHKSEMPWCDWVRLAKGFPGEPGDGRLCKPLNKVALSKHLTRITLASPWEFPKAGAGRPERDHYALSWDTLPWAVEGEGWLGSERQKGRYAHPLQKAALRGQTVSGQLQQRKRQESYTGGWKRRAGKSIWSRNSSGQ